jgi:hypothetical protein
MQIALYFAAFLTLAIGVVHSYLGERYILTPLFRRDDLPRIFGSSAFTIRTLRFAWHLTTVAWWGLAAVLILLAQPPLSASTVGAVVGITFLIHFGIAIWASRGRHLSWLIFLAIGIIAIYATRT